MSVATRYLVYIFSLFFLCELVLVSCEEDRFVNSGTQSSDDGPVRPMVTIDVDEVKSFSVTFKGQLNIPESFLEEVDVLLYYSDKPNFEQMVGVSARVPVTFDEEQMFSVALPNLEHDTKYYFCVRIYELFGEMFQSDIWSFTTLSHPNVLQASLDLSSAIDLSSITSANCYIISDPGLYKFKTLKGNSQTLLDGVHFVEVLWRSPGLDIDKDFLGLIEAFCYKDDYVVFKTAETFKEGNVLIAVKDALGNVLWSWHLWFTDPPSSQLYYNNAGIMMDRNLGALSAEPGMANVYGLLYQWGRKDPIPRNFKTNPVKSDLTTGTIAYAVANPTVFITNDENSSDWYFSSLENTDDSRWTTSDHPKSVYDPCPPGWRVPDGGEDGIWAKACGKSIVGCEFDHSDKGVNFSGIFGPDPIIWYPASGFIHDSGSPWGLFRYGYYWSATTDGLRAYMLDFMDELDFISFLGANRVAAFAVRCCQE